MVWRSWCGDRGVAIVLRLDRLRPPPSGVPGQKIEEAGCAEKFSNARGSVDDPKRRMRGRGQVVHLNQLAYAAGVQIRYSRQIQLQ